MKKLTTLFLLLVLLLSACATTPSVPELEKIGAAGQFNASGLLGMTRDQLTSVWGAPNPSLSGSWGDIWVIDEQAGSCLTIQYDSDDFVVDALMINDPPNTAPCELRRMIMIDDVLYYDTGRNQALPGCGMSDGVILSTVERSAYPTEDRQSNFRTELGYWIRAYEFEPVIQTWDGTEHALFAPKHLLESALFPPKLGAKSSEVSVGAGTLRSAILLNGEAAAFLTELVEAGSWESSGCTDCATDYMINIFGRVLHYHANCGTLNEFNVPDLLNATAQHKTLTPVQRACLNYLLNAYSEEK